MHAKRNYFKDLAPGGVIISPNKNAMDFGLTFAFDISLLLFRFARHFLCCLILKQFGLLIYEMKSKLKVKRAPTQNVLQTRGRLVFSKFDKVKNTNVFLEKE